MRKIVFAVLCLFIVSNSTINAVNDSIALEKTSVFEKYNGRFHWDGGGKGFLTGAGLCASWFIYNFSKSDDFPNSLSINPYLFGISSVLSGYLGAIFGEKIFGWTQKGRAVNAQEMYEFYSQNELVEQLKELKGVSSLSPIEKVHRVDNQPISFHISCVSSYCPGPKEFSLTSEMEKQVLNKYKVPTSGLALSALLALYHTGSITIKDFSLSEDLRCLLKEFKEAQKLVKKNSYASNDLKQGIDKRIEAINSVIGSLDTKEVENQRNSYVSSILNQKNIENNERIIKTQEISSKAKMTNAQTKRVKEARKLAKFCTIL